MDAIGILNYCNLNKTVVRISILEEFLKSSAALSEVELRKRVNPSFNRTSIYRSIRLFLENDIIHKITDDNGIFTYVLNRRLFSDEEIEHEHLHFQCRICNRVICMRELPIKRVKLPDGFIKEQSNFLVVGICKECNNSQAASNMNT